MLVDDESELRERIEGVRGEIEGELGCKVVVLDTVTKRGIREGKGERPGDEYRDGVKGDWPMCMFYTRYVMLRLLCLAFVTQNLDLSLSED